MKPLHLISHQTNLPFLRIRMWTLGLTALLMIASVVAIAVHGFEFGVDFRGGSVLEIRTKEVPDLSRMRTNLAALNLGEVSLQQFGTTNDVLIKVPQQPGDERAQLNAVNKVKETLGSDVDYRRVEFVGPQVGAELIERGLIAMGLALVGIMFYVWFRFSWQYGVSALLTTIHDVVATAGLFALLKLEFNLTTVAALLTIAGYSINDTVVVFDRIRESMRRYKSLALPDLLNRAINDTLSRTVMTSVTTALAVLSLFLFGGEVIRGFALAMLFGIVIGTYSSIFIATPILLWIPPDRTGEDAKVAAAKASAAKTTPPASARPKSEPASKPASKPVG